MPIAAPINMMTKPQNTKLTPGFSPFETIADDVSGADILSGATSGWVVNCKLAPHERQNF